MRKHVGPQWELRAVLARRDLRFAFASPPSAPTLAYYPSYGDIRDQGTIQGASVNQNRFTLGAVPIAEVDGPKAPAAIGLIGHTAAETFGPTESRVTASLSQNRGTVTGPTMALYVRQPVTYTESKDKINVQ